MKMEREGGGRTDGATHFVRGNYESFKGPSPVTQEASCGTSRILHASEI